MRFDLTQAAYRVFDRAAHIRLPNGLARIDAAKLLIALFGEEGTRAADRLAEANLSLDSFRTAFGLANETARLELPISAPPFPTGSYGISLGQPPDIGAQPPRTELSAASEDPPPRPVDVSDDQWIETATESAPQRTTYSIYTDYSADSGDTNRGVQILFFLDEQPVRIGRLSQELESTLWALLHRFGQQPYGGEIRTLPNIRFGLSSVTLATEHLLLAVALDEGEVGRWLHNSGIDPTELFERIDKISDNNKTHKHDFESSPVTADHGLITSHESCPTIPEHRISRLLDAVSNRASEALRVIEDYVRFVLNDRTLTLQLKEFRHELRRLLRPFSNAGQLSARNTELDVGIELETDGEYERRETVNVLSANFGRLQESLRSLEEFSKLETLQGAKEFEQLRYRSYTLHKEVLAANGTLSLRERVRDDQPPNRLHSLLESAKLYVLADAGADETVFREKIQSWIADGADLIQLRDKTADDRTLLDRAKIVRKLTRDSSRGVLFVMNDRSDVAKLAEADGVHVGQEELSVQEVRRIVGDEMLIGVSTHDIDQARTAVRDGADYLGVGPVFPSATKEFETFPGLEFLREVAAEIRIPAFAIGGIDADNLPQVLETGITRIAVSRAPLSSLSRYFNVLQSD